MMLVSTLFGSMFAGGTAAAAAGTAAAGAATAGAASTGLTILQGIGSVFTALSTIGAGYARANELKAAAAEERFRATDEQIKGEEEAAKLEHQLALTLQRQKVAFAAGGVDLGSQAVGAAQEQAVKEGERELQFSWYDAQRAAAARRRSARNMLAAAGSAVTQGYVGALSQLADYSTDVMARG